MESPRTINEATMLEIAFKAVRLYAETHPRPSHVNQLQAAEMLGKSRCTVARMIRFGTIRLNECGEIPISEIDRVLAAKAA